MAVTTSQQKIALNELLDKAETALANNVTFLNLVGPNNAQILAQVNKLTRQNNAIIRLLVGMYGRHIFLTNGTDT